ncbi:MAG: hypothetical protein DCC68_01910 [Planctomycetota bacterium]|nr:MAG: hypothetical protein DCC68_01910 [Planctomycetota bacterium]
MPGNNDYHRCIGGGGWALGERRLAGQDWRGILDADCIARGVVAYGGRIVAVASQVLAYT